MRISALCLHKKELHGHSKPFEYLWVALPWVSWTQPIWMLWRGEAGSQYLAHRALIHLHLSLTAPHEELMHFISLLTLKISTHGTAEPTSVRFLRSHSGDFLVFCHYSPGHFTDALYHEPVRMRQDIWTSPKIKIALLSTMPKRNLSWYIWKPQDAEEDFRTYLNMDLKS